MQSAKRSLLRSATNLGGGGLGLGGGGLRTGMGARRSAAGQEGHRHIFYRNIQQEPITEQESMQYFVATDLGLGGGGDGEGGLQQMGGSLGQTLHSVWSCAGDV